MPSIMCECGTAVDVSGKGVLDVVVCGYCDAEITLTPRVLADGKVETARGGNILISVVGGKRGGATRRFSPDEKSSTLVPDLPSPERPEKPAPFAPARVKAAAVNPGSEFTAQDAEYGEAFDAYQHRPARHTAIEASSEPVDVWTVARDKQSGRAMTAWGMGQVVASVAIMIVGPFVLTLRGADGQPWNGFEVALAALAMGYPWVAGIANLYFLRVMGRLRNEFRRLVEANGMEWSPALARVISAVRGLGTADATALLWALYPLREIGSDGGNASPMWLPMARTYRMPAMCGHCRRRDELELNPLVARKVLPGEELTVTGYLQQCRECRGIKVTVKQISQVWAQAVAVGFMAAVLALILFSQPGTMASVAGVEAFGAVVWIVAAGGALVFAATVVKLKPWHDRDIRRWACVADVRLKIDGNARWLLVEDAEFAMEFRTLNPTAPTKP